MALYIKLYVAIVLLHGTLTSRFEELPSLKNYYIWHIFICIKFENNFVNWKILSRQKNPQKKK